MDKLLDFLELIAGAGILLFAISLGAERGTEVVKAVLRWIGRNVSFLKGLAPKGVASWALALVPATAAVFGYDVNIFKDMELFADVDPELVQILNMLIIWLFSGKFHTLFGMNDAGEMPTK